MNTTTTAGDDLRRVLRKVRMVVFDFDGVFTDNMVYVFEDGREAVRCWRSDGLGLSRLRELGIGLMVLSTESNPVVGVRCQKLHVEYRQGLKDKGAVLRDVLEERGIGAASAAYVGNDINDRECLQSVGLPIVVADAHPDVVPLARYQTKARGGWGAVREVCDLLSGTLIA